MVSKADRADHVGHVHWGGRTRPGLTFDRRATQVASSTADLVRAEKQISHTEIGDIMKVGGYILEPYSQTPLEIALRNVTSSPANTTTTKQSWSCTYKGLDKTQTCECSNTHQEHPAQPAHPATTAAWSPRPPSMTESETATESMRRSRVGSRII
jgi:hypothetical protein